MRGQIVVSLLSRDGHGLGSQNVVVDLLGNLSLQDDLPEGWVPPPLPVPFPGSLFATHLAYKQGPPCTGTYRKTPHPQTGCIKIWETRKNPNRNNP